MATNTQRSQMPSRWLRIVQGLLLTLTLLTWAVGAPTVARAATPGGPQTWSKRLQFVLKSVHVSDDHDWGVGEIRLNARLHHLVPGCSPGPSDTTCRIFMTGEDRIPVRVNDGDTVTLDHRLPSIAPDAPGIGGAVNPKIGFPVLDTLVYVLAIEGLEEDFGADEELGEATLVLSRETNWHLGTNVVRGMKSEGTQPGDFSVEIEVQEAELPDPRPVKITLADLPGSPNQRVCMDIQNGLRSDAGPFEVTFKVDGIMPVGGKTTLDGLAIGRSWEVCVEVPPIAAGRHTLTAVVDDRQAMIELDETNNVYEQDYTIGQRRPSTGPARGTLTVTAITVNGQAPDGNADCLAGKNTVAALVKNAGDSALGRLVARLVIDGEPRSAWRQSVTGLAGGESREVRFGDVRLTKGEHKLVFTLDVTDGAAVFDEDTSWAVTVTCGSAV